MRAEDIAEEFPVIAIDSNAPDAARMLAEHRLPGMADRAADKLGGKAVREVLPDHLLNVRSADADDTILEVAAMMACSRSPFIAVVKDGAPHGVITASRLLAAVLKP
ncbi:CBS domain-containing protein [Mycobacterium branderi]|uniref:CBS domain-containing protein n=1 Tax=Mycobacterium branderi TaxID=43348 RepID=A0A7I7WEI7_9MYCO|nr:CBS domain-containing protein [Mycobacterium branderi]MCV7236410.1 CBS domain-containing protein [Mycobacterium branderi]ORA32583.1 hypothetical protein BST20_24590 [Mycobacterium branderi]BBZ15297.1 hypothetical protein MBRA_54920 [Mycobacterium branderi]